MRWHFDLGYNPSLQSEQPWFARGPRTIHMFAFCVLGYGAARLRGETTSVGPAFMINFTAYLFSPLALIGLVFAMLPSTLTLAQDGDPDLAPAHSAEPLQNETPEPEASAVRESHDPSLEHTDGQASEPQVAPSHRSDDDSKAQEAHVERALSANGEPIPAPPQIDTWEYIAFPAYLAAGLILKFGVDRGEPNWIEPPGFDREVTEALSLEEDSSVHEFWGRLGDIMYIGGVAYSGVSPFLTFNSSRGSEFAFKYGMVHFESLSFAAGTIFGLQMVIRRARPNADECLDGDPSTECSDGGMESFPGGHMTMATTVAALSCIHDTRLGMYDNEVAEWTTCGIATFGAVANLLSRLFVSKHYLSDQIAGIALGLFSGGLLPYLLHPDLGKPRDDGGGAGITATVAPRLGDGELGLQVLGMF